MSSCAVLIRAAIGLIAGRTLAAHTARGGVAAALLLGIFLTRPADLWVALPPLLIAIVLMRGCPMCWTATLLELVARRGRGRSVS
jgi:hypothetical protein